MKRGTPQGKIERWHQDVEEPHPSNYFFKEDLEAQIAAFIEHYNHRRYHRASTISMPADVYFGRGQTILIERERIKRDTIRKAPLEPTRPKRPGINPLTEPETPSLAQKSATVFHDGQGPARKPGGGVGPDRDR